MVAAVVNAMTKAEYARHRGCSREAVGRAIRDARITVLADGTIDANVADIQWARNSRVRAGAKASASQSAADVLGDGGDDQPGGDNYWTARSRREQAEAELAEIELAEKQGSVIQVKAVEAVWAQSLSSAREHLLQVRARLAPLLAVETDAFKIEQLLDAEHSRALEHLAHARVSAPERAST